MKAVLALLVSAAMAVGVAPPVAAAAPVQRFVLVIGANIGGGDRPKLQYAVSDAERFARVMVELGGVPQANETLLRQPKLAELVAGLDALHARVAAARNTKDPGRIEVIVYYSGHADEQGLLLGSDRYSYRSLRDRLDQIPADVRIAVLDACASGAFTRLKGGKVRPPFLVDESADMRGHAFLTSSAEAESAQESDRIRGSYFTHYLISGLRGAADLSGDGKITLNEAYQFAFNETLGHTVDTRGGAQHPSYDINLSGSGDVVMTDVRQTTATLVLGEDLDGRFFIRNAAQELVVELYKPLGRRVELGLEPGAYEVRLEREKTSMLAKAKIDDGATLTLDAKQFGNVPLEVTRRRGDAQVVSPFAVAGRHRIELVLGGAQAFVVQTPGAPALKSVSTSAGVIGGIQYTTFAREDLALTFGVIGRAAERSTVSTIVTTTGTAFLTLPVGVRWNPFTARHPSSQLKPFVGATIGPAFGVAGSIVSTANGTNVEYSQTTVGGDLLAGVDFHFGRPCSISVSGGYNWVGVHNNFGGAEFGVSFGFLWGNGR
jgi:hypothetical protein